MDAENSDRAIAPGSPYGVGSANTFSGVLSFFRRRYTKEVAGADIVVSGVPFDQAVTNRPGTRFGPRAIREASTNLAWSGGAWPWDFDPFETLNVCDFGDCPFDFGDQAGFADALEAHATGIIEQGPSMLTLGGDHFITYPLIKAHAKQHGPLALVQFDAHSDTWPEDSKRIDHGTMFYHGVQEGIIDPAHSVQIGIRTGNPDTQGITIIDADWVHENGPQRTIDRALEVIGNAKTYLTFDIDCLDPAFAPGTGTPVCGGLATWQARKVLQGLASVNFVAMDVVEVSPPYDHAGITALAAATVAFDYLAIRAQQKTT
ncbi:MAG: agmatinase [Hyphomicrobiaceae bacterium]